MGNIHDVWAAEREALRGSGEIFLALVQDNLRGPFSGAPVLAGFLDRLAKADPRIAALMWTYGQAQVLGDSASKTVEETIKAREARGIPDPWRGSKPAND